MYEAAKHSYDIFGNYMQTDSSEDEDDTQPTGPVNQTQLQSKEEKKAVPISQKATPKKAPETKSARAAASKKKVQPVVKKSAPTTTKSLNKNTSAKKTINPKPAAKPVSKTAPKKKTR